MRTIISLIFFMTLFFSENIFYNVNVVKNYVNQIYAENFIPVPTTVFPPTLPEINQKTIQGRKIRVGFIDAGHPFWNNAYLNKFSHSDITDSSLIVSKEWYHATGVMTSFLLTLEKYIPSSQSNIEIVYCAYDQQGMGSEFYCLNQMKDAHLDYLNLSFEGAEANQLELHFLTLISENTIITIAAGNSGKNKSSYPCSYEVKNSVCVGSLDENGQIASHSNRGHTVKTYEQGEYVLMYSTERSDGFNFGTGTSFAAPVHLAKLVAGSIKGLRFDYQRRNEIFVKKNIPVLRRIAMLVE
jgi:hypothetical protein